MRFGIIPKADQVLEHLTKNPKAFSRAEGDLIKSQIDKQYGELEKLYLHFHTHPELSLIALFTQATLYGLYVATLIHCLRWLIYTDDGWKQRDGVNKLMLITTVVIFLLSTVNLAISLPFQFYVMGAFTNLATIGFINVRRYHG